MERKAKLFLDTERVEVWIPNELMQAKMENGMTKIRLPLKAFDLNLDKSTIATVILANWDKIKQNLSFLEQVAIQKWANENAKRK